MASKKCWAVTISICGYILSKFNKKAPANRSGNGRDTLPDPYNPHKILLFTGSFSLRGSGGGAGRRKGRRKNNTSPSKPRQLKFPHRAGHGGSCL